MGSLKQRRKARAKAQAESGGTNVGDPMPHKEQAGFYYAKRRV